MTSTTISHVDRLIALIDTELASTEMSAHEFDLQGCVEQLRQYEIDRGEELTLNTDGLLIAATLEDYWFGE